MKRSGRVFIFGAGVSKAVAGAPVMQELYSRMEQRYEYEKNRKDCPWGNNRIKWFEKIRGFIDMLDIQGKRRLAAVLKVPDRKVSKPVHEDIEYLVTLLDLHTSYGPLIRFEEPGVDINPYPFNPLPYTSPGEMKEIRNILTTYLYLCLSGIEDQKDILGKFFREHVDPPDQLITFNYDLLI